MDGKPQAQEREALYQNAEMGVNRFNLKWLAVLSLLSALAEALAELDVFTLEKHYIRAGMTAAILPFLLPIAVFIFHDSRHPDDSILKRSGFKYFLVVCSYLGIAAQCISMTYHVAILMAVPPILAAQYRDQKRLLGWTLAATALLVPVSVFGGFFVGVPDRNLLKSALALKNMSLADRVALATPQRMIELFWHHAVPRLITVIAVAMLASGITRRNTEMLEKQAELSEQIQEEMEKKTLLQSRVIDALATLIETRDVGTGEHVIRTKKYVGMIARAMQQDEQYKSELSDHLIEEIESAAALHDVGKIAVSDVILLKPGKLTAEEFEEMKKHSEKGGQVIRNIFSTFEDDTAFLKIAEEIAVSHHEKWNGKGYPQGLEGEAIPLPARIMAVADVFDALVSVRVYKPSMTPEAAMELIESESGTHFDPSIIRVVASMRQELIEAAKAPV
ncbi:MAG: HD domain-containing protein [Clostridia bacterium]|nr:HD domain-containing protein [Clostridia bacterium]